MKKLVYFTTSFPYGLGENWKFNELSVFTDFFDDLAAADNAVFYRSVARLGTAFLGIEAHYLTLFD